MKQLPVRSYGPSYFRQSLKIKGKEGRLRMKGEIQLDYSLASGPTYCFSRSESRVAPAQGYGRSIRQLRSVRRTRWRTSGLVFLAVAITPIPTSSPTLRSRR